MRLRKLRYKHVPSRLIIETTTRCNASCVYCGNRAVPKMDMDFGLYKRIVDVTPYVKRIDPLSRGEPLMYPHIVEAIAYAKSKGKEVVVHTNGSLLITTMSVALLETGLDLLVFSIDEIDPDRFAKIRRGLNISTILANVQAFNLIREECGYSTKTAARICRTEANEDRLDEIINGLVPYFDEVNTMPELEVLSSSEVLKRPICYGEPLECIDPYRNLVVRPDGRVVFCCTDWYDNFTIGKVSEQVTERELLDIFNSKQMNYFRNGMKKGRIPAICTVCRARTGVKK